MASAVRRARAPGMRRAGCPSPVAQPESLEHRVARLRIGRCRARRRRASTVPTSGSRRKASPRMSSSWAMHRSRATSFSPALTVPSAVASCRATGARRRAARRTTPACCSRDSCTSRWMTGPRSTSVRTTSSTSLPDTTAG